MRFDRVSIAGLGYDLPPLVLTSAAIEDRLAPVYERLGLCAGRLEMMTGIRERRYWPGSVRPSEIATRAGEHALERSGLPREAIGCIIHASVCRDFLEPATANVVHDRMKLPRTCSVFDVSNACLGVMNGILIVADMIELGRIRAGIVVAGENGKPLLDSTIDRLLSEPGISRKSIKSSFASLTIGSGAAAVVLASPDLVRGDHRLLGATIRAATEHHHLCLGGDVAVREGRAADAGVLGEGTLLMSTDAEALLGAGIDLARENWRAFVEEVSWSSGAPARVLTHQVGRAHQRALFEALGLSEEDGFVTYDRFGNTGSVSLPLALALAVDQSFVRERDEVALLGIGSGLSSVMLGVRW